MDPEEVTTLVRRARSGDRTAWNAIVDEYANLLWSVVRSFRLGEAQAADAVQTTWLRLVEHLDAIREPGRLAGWLRTTASRVCLEIIRESGRERLVDSPDERALAGHHPCLSADAPETSLLRHEHERLLREALADLPGRDRALVNLLTCPQPLSYHDISERLDMPIGSIGPTRARILGRLRTALESAGLYDAALG
jgi:RNA polymerase sigma factor (sigma-70 family)